MIEKQKRIAQLLRLVRDGSGKGVPEGTAVKNVAKIIYERYANQDLVRLKLFLLTGTIKGVKLSNNKPYSLDELITKEEFLKIDKELYEVVRHQSSVFSLDGEHEEEVKIPEWMER